MVQVEDLVDVEVSDAHLFGELVEGFAVLASDAVCGRVDVSPTVRVAEVMAERFDGDVVHRPLGVGRVGLQGEVDVVGEPNGQLMC